MKYRIVYTANVIYTLQSVHKYECKVDKIHFGNEYIKYRSASNALDVESSCEVYRTNMHDK